MKKSSGDRTVRLHVNVSEDELQAIDAYRLQFRLPNRSAAVRALLQTGMTSTNKDNGADNEKAAN
jgi:metal-responsive CopG/Arc/MetJ family transcriptional regulator